MALLTRLSDALRKAVKFFPGSKPANRELAQLLQTLAALNANITVNDANTLITLASGVSLELTGNTARLRLVGGADLLFDGTTGQNKIIVPDNLANALEFQDVSGNEIAHLTSTTGSLALTVAAVLNQTGHAAFSGGVTGHEQYQLVSATPHTVGFTDSGKVFYTSIADVVFDLPSSGSGTLAGRVFTFVTGAASAGTGLSISPAAVDKIEGKGITAADDKDYINSGATDAVGDLVKIVGTADGWLVVNERGTWAREA